MSQDPLELEVRLSGWQLVAIVLGIAFVIAAGLHAASWVGRERARQSVECAKNPVAVWQDGQCQRIPEQ